MNGAPLVSVIIATYRRSQFLPRAIESALRQTHRDIEVVVVDDASPDDTERVVESMRESRVRYLRHERNKGLPAARNTGIGVAEGDYLAFLDDDDQWHPDKVKKQIQAAQMYDAVLTGALVNGERIKLHGKSEVIPADLRRGNAFDPSSLLAKASLLRQLRFDENLRHGEDWDMFIRLAEVTRIGYVNEPLLLYSDGAHPRMTNEAENLSLDQLERRMAVLRKHEEFFGPYWFDQHVAGVLLSYLGYRSGKVRQIAYAIRRCGAVAVLGALTNKIASRVSNAMLSV